MRMVPTCSRGAHCGVARDGSQAYATRRTAAVLPSVAADPDSGSPERGGRVAYAVGPAGPRGVSDSGKFEHPLQKGDRPLRSRQCIRPGGQLLVLAMQLQQMPFPPPLEVSLLLLECADGRRLFLERTLQV